MARHSRCFIVFFYHERITVYTVLLYCVTVDKVRGIIAIYSQQRCYDLNDPLKY